MAKTPNYNLVSFFLRGGVGIVFLYAAISATFNPSAWLGFVPLWIEYIIPAGAFLTLFSIFQLLLAGWLFSGRKTFHAGVLASITMFAITVANIQALDIVFRDFAIFLMAITVAIIGYKKR